MLQTPVRTDEPWQGLKLTIESGVFSQKEMKIDSKNRVVREIEGKNELFELRNGSDSWFELAGVLISKTFKVGPVGIVL